MPSRSDHKISDWASRLGIRELQSVQMHASCPEVDLLRNDIKRIMEQFHELDVHEIQTSMEIRDAAGALLDKYGPIIWCDNSVRPWLFNPGDSEKRAEARYERHLYYSRDSES